MTVVLVATAGLLGLAGLLTLARMLLGPGVNDRLVAFETLTTVVVSGIAVQAALRGEGADVFPIVVVALVGFLGTVAVVRLTDDGDRS